MTRYRVLQRTKLLLDKGFLPVGKPVCTTVQGVEVSETHPEARFFNIWSAIKRAIFETTEETYAQRFHLWETTTDAVEYFLGGDALKADNKLRAMTKKEQIKVIDDILKQMDDAAWN